MSNLYTINDLNIETFYQLPKGLIHNPKYSTMKNDSKLAYTLLKDLLSLSSEKGWYNEKGEIYVKLSREKLMERLNIKGKQKMAEIMKELSKYNLIQERFVGLKKCNEIYIQKIEDLNKFYSDKDLLTSPETSDTNCGLKIKPLGVRKSNHKPFENQTHINNCSSSSIKENIKRKDSKKDIKLNEEEEVKSLDVLEKRENDKRRVADFSDELLDMVEILNDNMLFRLETRGYNFKHFKNAYEKMGREVLEEIIKYQAEIGTRLYAGFKIALDNTFKDCKSVEEVLDIISEYRKSKDALKLIVEPRKSISNKRKTPKNRKNAKNNREWVQEDKDNSECTIGEW